MIYFYEHEGHLLASLTEQPFSRVPAPREAEALTWLQALHGSRRRFYCPSEPSMLFDREERLLAHVKTRPTALEAIPDFVTTLIARGRVRAVNTLRPDFARHVLPKPKTTYRVHVVGLGDVGMSLVVGLRLLGAGVISEIGLYSPDKPSALRAEFEAGQIYPAFCAEEPPSVSVVSLETLMDCDVLVFAVSKSVPAVGEDVGDVRMVQYEANASILAQYATLARETQFAGCFAVVSDPVDPLCRYAYRASNTDAQGNPDQKGLGGEQIRGFGLGVMNARAHYYARQTAGAETYAQKGRAYGPHGKGLVIANDIEHYDARVSEDLTARTLAANLALRALGYKPYLAPAFSSGALSLCAYLRGEYHYSSLMIDDAFMGMKNRETPYGTQTETANLDARLLQKLEETHAMLRAME